MLFLGCYISVAFSLFLFVPIQSLGDFWFVTDFHVDQNYSRTGNPNKLCHQEETILPDVGLYGNFLCDSPLSLLNATIVAMKEIQPNPDFIVWTGDNLPHTLKVVTDWDITFEAIKNISDLMSSTFPNVTVYPSIGNHDTSPPNIIVPNESTKVIYQGYLEKGGWNKFLSENATATFLQGGFYSDIIKPGLKIISLNTILWYYPNKHTKDMADPEDQFKWLNETLRDSLLNAEKVYIIGHVPPGFYNRNKLGTISDPTFHHHFLNKYLDILHRYSEIILGQMYGHLHMDMFQLFDFNTGVFKSSSMLGSSITPWHFVDKSNMSLPVYPSIRLMHYDEIGFSLKDFDQYYLNLTKVNAMAEKDLVLEQSNLYEHLYKFTDAYNVPDLSTNSFVQIYEMMKKNASVYNTFYRFLTAGMESSPCGDECLVAQLCSISCTTAEEYSLCMKSSPPVNPPSNQNVNIIITVIVVLIIIVLIAMLIIYQRYSKNKCWKSRQEREYESFMDF